jgi:adenylate kinase
MKRVVAVLGVSGVGKSTFVRAIGMRLPLLHLQASDLIKAAQARRQASVSTSEELRLGPVADNQQLLIDSFAEATATATGLVVFDGHAVIFGASITEIAGSVFSNLGCSMLLVIEAAPSIIRSRRLGDIGRARPDLSEAEIGVQQQHATKAAVDIAKQLGIPIHIIAAADVDVVMSLLEASDGPATGDDKGR